MSVPEVACSSLKSCAFARAENVGPGKGKRKVEADLNAAVAAALAKAEKEVPSELLPAGTFRDGPVLSYSYLGYCTMLKILETQCRNSANVGHIAGPKESQNHNLPALLPYSIRQSRTLAMKTVIYPELP